MNIFYITAILNVLFFSFILAMIDGGMKFDITDEALGRLLVSTIIDIPLVFTILIAVFCRNISLSLFLVAISSLASKLLLNSVTMEVVERAAYSILSQGVLAILINRCTANWNDWRMVGLKVYSGYVYKKTSIEPLDWRWRERVQNFIQSLTSLLDKVSIPIFLIGVIVSLINSSSGFLYTFLGFYAVWVFYIVCVVSPLTIAETASRFLFSASKSNSPREIANKGIKSASATLDEIGQVLNEKDIPHRTKVWLKEGFMPPTEMP